MVKLSLGLIFAYSYSQADEKYPFSAGMFNEFMLCLV
jgi:hypothetical protein